MLLKDRFVPLDSRRFFCDYSLVFESHLPRFRLHFRYFSQRIKLSAIQIFFNWLNFLNKLHARLSYKFQHFAGFFSLLLMTYTDRPSYC